MTDFAQGGDGTELVVVSAADDASLLVEVRRIVDFIDRVREVPLSDIAYTCSLSHGRSVLAVIASTTLDLRSRLSAAAARMTMPGVVKIRDKSGTYFFRQHLLGDGGGKLAYLYPGVFSFYPDMLRDLAVLHPECRGPFDELEEAMVGVEDFTPSNFIFPPADYYRHDADIFRSGAYAQALVSTYAASAAMTRRLKSLGLRPDGVIGFAGGELAALMCSGAVGENPPRPERVKFLRDIYAVVNKAVSHGGLPKTVVISTVMRHPGEADDVVRTFPSEKARMVLELSPRQRFYAVDPDFADAAVAAFSSAGIRVSRLALDLPFNTPLCSKVMEPAIGKFADAYLRSKPACDVYSCATVDRVEAKPRRIRRDTFERWSKPVRFAETVCRMRSDGYRVFLEVGPRGLLARAVGDVLRSDEVASIAMNSIHRRGELQSQHALAQLAALGAELDFSVVYARRNVRRLDFDSSISLTARRDVEMRLSRALPMLTLLSGVRSLPGTEYLAEPKGRGAKAAARAAVQRERLRRQRQFDFGALHPLIADAEEIDSSPGVTYSLIKTLKIAEAPFLDDFAYGSSQISYDDTNLRGLVTLSIPVAIEIMAETAMRVMPNRTVIRIENCLCRRQLAFTAGKLSIAVLAERVPASDPHYAAVQVQIRAFDENDSSKFTWPALEATVILNDQELPCVPAAVGDLFKPRAIHWSGREIYPAKLCFGKRLRGIAFAESWGEDGLDYEVIAPSLADNLVFTRFPQWAVDPLLLQTVVSGFRLWRSHEKFPGAFSFPFAMRRLTLRGARSNPGSRLRCYMRLTGVTPGSHVCDIVVTGGDGNVIMEVSGWEESAERVPQSYCDIVLQPATVFVSESLSRAALGDPATDISSAIVTDVPYPIFEQNECLWLKILSHVVLSVPERLEFDKMSGSVSRRTEWLFGRIVAKEAVRRFLKERYQARWGYADVRIWKNDKGKPIPLGKWSEYLTAKLDVAIAHTAQFFVAVAAANARVGVDVESVSRNLSEEFAEGVFADDERDLAASAVNPAQALIRFWCAKEAVSKALGVGIRYSPREMTVTEYQPDAGKLVMRLSGGWIEEFKNFKGRDIYVTTRVVRDHSLAFCFMPFTLFNDSNATAF